MMWEHYKNLYQELELRVSDFSFIYLYIFFKTGILVPKE